MKKTAIITILAFALGVVLLAGGFILFTDNNISAKIFVTTTTTTTTATSPSSGEPNSTVTKPMNLFEVDINQYITLGKYKDLDVKVEKTEITDEFVDYQIYWMLYQNKAYTQGKTGVVEENVIFNFDFVGYIDGVAFENGSGKNTDAYIVEDEFILTSGTTFIPGFAEGVLGGKVGKEFSIFVTFPENYGNDLAGKRAEFKILINYIVEAKLTDAWVKENTQGAYNTAQEFENYARDYFEDSLHSQNTSSVLMAIAKESTIKEIPQQEYDYYYNYYTKDLQSYADSFGMTLDEFLASGYASYFGVSNFTSVEQIKKYVTEIVKEELVLYAVIARENIQYSQEEYDDMLNQMAEAENLEVDAFIEKYTQETVRDFIHQTLLLEKAEKFVYESNNLVVE